MLPASVNPSLRVVRCSSCAPSRASSSCTLRLTVVLGRRRVLAAAMKLPCSTTLTKTRVSLRSRAMGGAPFWLRHAEDCPNAFDFPWPASREGKEGRPGIGPSEGQLFPDLPTNQVPVGGVTCAASRQASLAMSAPTRRRLLQSALVLLTLIDLQLLASFVFNQWFDLSMANAMGLAALLAIPLTLLLLPLVDAILANLERDADVGFSG